MKGEKKTMTQTTIRLPDDLLAKIRIQSIKEKRPMSEIIRVLIEDYLERVEQ